MVLAALLDTNIVIALINDQDIGYDVRAFRDVSISAITVMELYALAGTSDVEPERIGQFITQCMILPVGLHVARKAGLLSRTRKRGEADLLIAATAIEHDLSLLTRNVKDFRNIPGLKLAELIE